jgi:hypothetical protein
MSFVVKYPDSTKTSLEQRLQARVRQRWPDLASVSVRHRGTFSYIDGVLADGTTLKLCRLRYGGSAHQWGFAIYRASHDDYEDSFCRPDRPSAPANKPSTPPAASTSATPPPGPDPRRTYGRDH